MNKNGRVLLRKILEEPGQREHSRSSEERTGYREDAVFPHLIHAFSKIPFKPQLPFGVEIDKMILRVLWEFQLSQAEFTKSKALGSTPLNFTAHFKVTTNKVFRAWWKEKEIDEIDVRIGTSKNKLITNRTIDFFNEDPSAIWWQNENLFNKQLKQLGSN